MPSDPFDSLPPWDAAVWFQTVKETYFASPSPGAQVATADPQRVALIFATGATSAFVSLNSKGVGTQGIAFSINSGPITLTFGTHGPLVQQDWYSVTQGVSNITVYEIRLRDWPRGRLLAPSPQVRAYEKTNPLEPS